MKDRYYILTKLLKKQTMALILFSVLMVLFFVALFNRPVAYASEQIAVVSCEVSLVNDDHRVLLAKDIETISNLEESEISFSDIDVKLERNSKIEFDYIITNISNSNCAVNLSLNDKNIENFVVEYYVNDEFCGELIKLESCVESMENINIKVVVYVENPRCDAVLGGSLELIFRSVGDANG